MAKNVNNRGMLSIIYESFGMTVCPVTLARVHLTGSKRVKTLV